MLVKSDVKVLSNLVDQYPLPDIIRALAWAARHKADELSDQGLKERAVELRNGADHLADVAVDL